MAIEELPIFCYYDRQRFTQFGAMDCANWYGIQVESGKKKQALYPAMGRQHITFGGQNQLIFSAEPRLIFKSINFFYVIDGTQVFQYDKFYNQKIIGNVSLTGNLWFSILPVNTVVYIMLTDGTNIYIITENGTNVTMGTVTDPNAPGGGNNPGSPAFVATFGNRFVVSTLNTPQFTLSVINLGGSVVDLNTCFTINGAALFAQATGIIRQLAVLHNQLYIFNDFTTDIWGNISTQITVAGATFEFPFKLNSSYNFDYGMEDPFSLSVSFGRMTWLGQNQEGSVSFFVSDGGRPQDISTQAINVLLQDSTHPGDVSPFLTQTVRGFLYQYENTIFYRAVVGIFISEDILDLDEDNTVAIEYNFETQTWGRVIELNGERNRIQQHVFFNNIHLVTIEEDSAIYEMAGNIYTNELRTPNTGPQDANAFTQYPMRYELVTRQLALEAYEEFIDDYVQIDFVFGDEAFFRSDAPFLNTVFIVGEGSTPTNPIYIVTEDGKYVIQEGTNFPTSADSQWNALYKPHIELYISDDGGVTFLSADAREPWQLGEYRWIMRWNELGTSRNRCYKLVCVSPAPIVILGAVRNTRRASGGAN
ncbi:hypothetical protein [Pedobacter sp.]|jgi:hypothetical protein|uniref:hypothetical protein n=1 Tax=Pedobacter sp. TaxID=1411316 RepID=UPI002D072286|nr:hypothetical protein [Pedobacter sp.]HWW39673.1 hypothetical protein [Pedobacter sp.]